MSVLLCHRITQCLEVEHIRNLSHFVFLSVGLSGSSLHASFSKFKHLLDLSEQKLYFIFEKDC